MTKMADILSREQRSYCMSQNRGKSTSPEMMVRRAVHSLGYRYRLHRRDLPGCPDLLFPSRKKVIFVNGCYWHRHNCRKGRSIPETRENFWQNKFERTKERDKANLRKLKNLGWEILIIWECQIEKSLAERITEFLG